MCHHKKKRPPLWNCCCWAIRPAADRPGASHWSGAPSVNVALPVCSVLFLLNESMFVIFRGVGGGGGGWCLTPTPKLWGSVSNVYLWFAPKPHLLVHDVYLEILWVASGKSLCCITKEWIHFFITFHFRFWGAHVCQSHSKRDATLKHDKHWEWAWQFSPKLLWLGPNMAVEACIQTVFQWYE